MLSSPSCASLGWEQELHGESHRVGWPRPIVVEVVFVLRAKLDRLITEAHKLGIPVVGVVDTNNNPTAIDYVIPGNDDSIRAVQLYVQSAATAILQGKANSLNVTAGEDEFVEMDAVPAVASAEA